MLKRICSRARSPPLGSVVHVAIDGKYRGCFVLASALRPETGRLICGLCPQTTNWRC